MYLKHVDVEPHFFGNAAATLVIVYIYTYVLVYDLWPLFHLLQHARIYPVFNT